MVYKLTVTYSNAQFDKPISKEAHIPIGISHRICSFNEIRTRQFFCIISTKNLIPVTKINFVI